MENSIIQINSVSKNFDDLEVIKDISFDINKGNIVCLLGPSGCGKTTLLRIVANLEKPTTGKVVTRLKLPSAKLGYMSQADSLLPWRTAYENISLALELTGKKSKKAVLSSLRSIKLAKFRDYYPSSLSGGQCQRINLARTLVLMPELLLLDEPLSSVDVVVKNDLSKMIKKYVRENDAGALIVTHSIEEAMILADTVYILSHSPAIVCDKFDVKKLGDGAYNAISQALQKAIKQ